MTGAGEFCTLTASDGTTVSWSSTPRRLSVGVDARDGWCCEIRDRLCGGDQAAYLATVLLDWLMTGSAPDIYVRGLELGIRKTSEDPEDWGITLALGGGQSSLCGHFDCQPRVELLLARRDIEQLEAFLTAAAASRPGP